MRLPPEQVEDKKRLSGREPYTASEDCKFFDYCGPESYAVVLSGHI